MSELEKLIQEQKHKLANYEAKTNAVIRAKRRDIEALEKAFEKATRLGGDE